MFNIGDTIYTVQPDRWDEFQIMKLKVIYSVDELIWVKDINGINSVMDVSEICPSYKAALNAMKPVLIECIKQTKEELTYLKQKKAEIIKELKSLKKK